MKRSLQSEGKGTEWRLGDKARTQEGGHRCRCRHQPEPPVYSHNEHLLSAYCVLGTTSHTEPVDESDGK